MRQNDNLMDICQSLLDKLIEHNILPSDECKALLEQLELSTNNFESSDSDNDPGDDEPNDESSDDEPNDETSDEPNDEPSDDEPNDEQNDHEEGDSEAWLSSGTDEDSDIDEPNSKKQLYEALNNLFPVDIINTIFLYAENKLIILLQDYLPHLLKYITIHIKKKNVINENNCKYVTKLDCRNSTYMADALLKQFINLKELHCGHCPNITSASIIKLVNLTQLLCYDCKNITDSSIMHLVNLKKLECWRCDKITDKSISKLVNLIELSCSDCHEITDKSIKHLINLTYLDCSYCEQRKSVV